MLQDLYSIRYHKKNGVKTYHLIVLLAEDDSVTTESRKYSPEEMPLLLQYIRDRAKNGERLFTCAPMTQIEREIDHRRSLPMIPVTDLPAELEAMRAAYERRKMEGGEGDQNV